MTDAPFFVLDANSTGGTRFLNEQGDTLAWVRADIFPPVGTEVTLPNGSEAYVERLVLDLSDESQTARIFVTVSQAPPASAPSSVPGTSSTRVRV
jgi:hypothetical protein